MTHHELPLPDYDQLPTGAIESRVGTLGERQVRELYGYERSRPAPPLMWGGAVADTGR